MCEGLPLRRIKAHFTTRSMDCTLRQICAGACPTNAIKFVERWNDENLKPEGDRELRGGKYL
jgi:radical SAM protein with 4Fe4S-binding SPASM domain